MVLQSQSAVRFVSAASTLSLGALEELLGHRLLNDALSRRSEIEVVSPQIILPCLVQQASELPTCRRRLELALMAGFEVGRAI